MLILSRRPGEAIQLELGGVTVQVAVASVRGDVVKLGFDAPVSVRIMREELAGGWVDRVPPLVSGSNQ